MSLAVYANFTGLTAADARRLKGRIRESIHSGGGIPTRIYRNPFSPERQRYRFIRVHYKLKDTQ